jgi:hypothetical protein
MLILIVVNNLKILAYLLGETYRFCIIFTGKHLRLILKKHDSDIEE